VLGLGRVRLQPALGLSARHGDALKPTASEDWSYSGEPGYDNGALTRRGSLHYRPTGDELTNHPTDSTLVGPVPLAASRKRRRVLIRRP